MSLVSLKRMQISWFLPLAALAVADVMFLPSPVFARRTKVAVTDVGTVITTITLTVPTGQQLDVTVKNNASGASNTVHSNGTAGTVSVNPSAASSTESFTITIGGDTFSGVTEADSGKELISTEEKNRGASLNLRDTSGSAVALAASNSVIFNGGERGTDLPPGTFWDEFAVVNSSSDSFLLTSLRLYQNVDGSFFTPALFDSVAAISSGTLEQDVAAQIGDLTIGGNSELSFSELAAGSSQYDLLVGTVNEILPGGGLGPAQNFAIGNGAVPEPGSLTFVCIAAGFGAMIGRRHQRSRIDRG